MTIKTIKIVNYSLVLSAAAVNMHHVSFSRFKTEYNSVNLNRLQYFIDSKRIDPNEKITNATLFQSGAVTGKVKDGIKILGAVSCGYQCNSLMLYNFNRRETFANLDLFRESLSRESFQNGNSRKFIQ